MASIAPRTPIGYRLREWAEGVTFPETQKRIAAIAALLAVGAFWGALVGLAGGAAAILCVGLFACIFTLRDFRVGVALLIAIMPISQSYIFPHEMFGITGANPLNLLIMATLVSLFMRSLGDGSFKHFMPKPLFLLYILPLVMGAAIGMFHVEEIPPIFHDLELIFYTNAAGYWRDMFGKPLTFVIYALLIAAAVERSERSERFITPMTISVFVMAGAAIIFVLLSGVSLSQLSGVYARQFFSAIGMHANDLGRLYATAFGLLLFIWDRTDSRALQTTMILAMGLVAAALVLTFSRGAFFGFILVNLIYLLSRRRPRTYILAALLLPVGLWLAPGALWSRLSMGIGQGANEVSAGRTNEIWAPLLPELFKSPVWGDGVGSILWSNAMLEGRLPAVAHPHNAYLQAFMDLGAIGLVMLFAFWVYCWFQFRKQVKNASLRPELQGFFEGAAAGVVAFLAAGFAGSTLMPAAEQGFLWLAIGVMFGVRMRSRMLEKRAAEQSKVKARAAANATIRAAR